VNGIRSFLRRAGARIGRPSSPLGWVKYGAVALGLAVLLVAALAVGAVAAATFYDQYGPHQARNARAWAALTPQYAASSGDCAQCHATEFGKWSASKHVPVGCQTCHGALAEHAATAPVPASAAEIDAQEAGAAPAPSLGTGVAPIPPTDALCTVCHAETLGRPAGFEQVDPATHYPGTSCLQCHDVHTAIAIPPPAITHSLENVPECTACHGTTATNGVKAMPAGHQLSSDAICLGCHKPSPGTPQVRPGASTTP
jgi:hypothetical protein